MSGRPENPAFSFSLRVRYAETDAQGIVFNANYLMYFDVAVTEYFRWAGIPYAQFVEEHGLDFHVVHAELDYKAPARFDDEIRIALSGEFSGPRIVWSFSMTRDSETLCTGKIHYVCVEKTSGKVRRISPELAGLLRWQAR